MAEGDEPLLYEWIAVLILPKSPSGICPLPEVVRIDRTGYGGHDLGGPHAYDLCLRTDKHGQGVYGPSVAALETSRYDNRSKYNVVALGGTEAMQEFLVLHYFAMDSASCWDTFLTECLPNGEWVNSESRRATLMNMFDRCRIPPPPKVCTPVMGIKHLLAARSLMRQRQEQVSL